MAAVEGAAGAARAGAARAAAPRGAVEGAVKVSSSEASLASEGLSWLMGRSSSPLANE